MSNGGGGQPQPNSAPSSENVDHDQNDDGDEQSVRTRRRRRQRRQRNKNKEKAFVGETAEMNENVFQTLTESGDRRQFTKTLEALERYINKKLRYPGDLKSLYQDLSKPVLVDPPYLTDAEAKTLAKHLFGRKRRNTT